MFDHATVSKKWSKRWQESGVYEPKNISAPKNPFYNLMMFPYPSAEGMHVGNMYAFSGADIFGRFQRMRGHDVFEPIGLDGFGIHSENYAMKIGKHPAEQAKTSEANFYRQLTMIGNSYAWNEHLETYDPEYYKWTQWLFIQMFKNGLAYKGKSFVNWCPSCKTVLADEQVEDGRCERCKSEVTRKEAEQWFFKITKYADRLLKNIDQLRWPDKIRTAQRQWIGKASGLEIDFLEEKTKQILTVWTTYWETIFGVTFLVLAPEHPMIASLPIPAEKRAEVDQYRKTALNKTEQQRKMDTGEKSGVFTGVYVKNPVNGSRVPVWIADYVLAGVGTSAVMGVPAHDQRDFEFAQAHGLPVVQVVRYAEETKNAQILSGMNAVSEDGMLTNSGSFDGLQAWSEGKISMSSWMREQGMAREQTTYHLRDWLISRQRYWGPPIPMIYCEDCGWQPVPESQLPVVLPHLDEYKPLGNGTSPLENAPESWLWTECPLCGKKAKRETDVSDTFLDSSWYFLRYPTLALRPEKQAEHPFDPEVTKKWLPVSAYIGGAEHAVLHLLYSRFVTMALKDWGHLDFEEPFPFLFGHGLIIKDGAKMSKSKGNVVNPDEYIEKFGADALRTYLMFLGPYDQGGDFRDTGIAATAKWLQKIWFLASEKSSATQTTPELYTKLHKTIRKCTRDIQEFRFNTAIAALMECANVWQEESQRMSQGDMVKFLSLLAPFAPFLTEEAFHVYGKAGVSESESIHRSEWPSYDEEAVRDASVEIVVQVNGKVRARVTLSSDIAQSQEGLIVAVEQDEKVSHLLRGINVQKKIAVAGKLVNYVVS